MTVLTAVLLAVAGCSDSTRRAEIEGTITLRSDQPLAKGRIRFVPVDGDHTKAVFADIVDGRYRLAQNKGPVLGKNKIQITSDRPTGRQIRDPDGPAGSTIPEIDQFLPAKYNLRTELEIDVQAGRNEFSRKLEVE